jgi:hypothetical protein
MLKFTYKGSFLTIKKAYKICCIENPNGELMLWCLFYVQNYFFGKTLKSQFFGGNFKVPQANCHWVDFGKIWQFWAVLGKFSCYSNG